MKDGIGQDVYPGDILYEITGWIFYGNEDFRVGQFWEMPPVFDGQGIAYNENQNGEPYEYRWVYLDRSIKVSNKALTKEFRNAFYNKTLVFSVRENEVGFIYSWLESCTWEEIENLLHLTDNTL